MLRTLYDGVPFPLLLAALVAIGLAWYLAICGGLYVLLNRSRYAERARRWKTQLRATRAEQVPTIANSAEMVAPPSSIHSFFIISEYSKKRLML